MRQGGYYESRWCLRVRSDCARLTSRGAMKATWEECNFRTKLHRTATAALRRYNLNDLCRYQCSATVAPTFQSQQGDDPAQTLPFLSGTGTIPPGVRRGWKESSVGKGHGMTGANGRAAARGTSKVAVKRGSGARGEAGDSHSSREGSRRLEDLERVDPARPARAPDTTAGRHVAG